MMFAVNDNNNEIWSSHSGLSYGVWRRSYDLGSWNLHSLGDPKNCLLTNYGENEGSKLLRNVSNNLRIFPASFETRYESSAVVSTNGIQYLAIGSGGAVCLHEVQNEVLCIKII
jgi:hypothetical protein